MEQTKLDRKSSHAVPREVPFVVRAKGASEVVLTGDFTRWAKEGVRLRKGPNDEWRTTLELEPGEYQYRLIVDGAWQDDPQAANRVPNPFGGQNCVLRVPTSRVER
jgi:1,4-alpha-glucan branching enzyme